MKSTVLAFWVLGLALSIPGFATEFVSDEESDQHFWDQVVDELSISTTSDEEDEIETDELELDEIFTNPTLTPSATFAPAKMLVEVFKQPVGMGIRSEFGIVSIDGKVKRGFVVSTANPRKLTKSGNKPVTPSGGGKSRALIVGKKTTKVNGEKISLPFPFKLSTTYKNSPMFWPLAIDIKTSGGYPYWIHSTTHYNELGKPASMGCVRLSHPSAMELFDLAVNQVKGALAIRIYDSGSELAKKSILEKEKSQQITLASLKQQIFDDILDAHAVSKKNYNGNGHARRGQKLVYPKCGAYDCFAAFGVKKRLK